jgi:hypothetical protein
MRRVVTMQGETGERWKELCAQAAVEKDPKKLLALIREINDLLEDKRGRLMRDNSGSGSSGSGSGEKPLKSSRLYWRTWPLFVHLLPYKQREPFVIQPI